MSPKEVKKENKKLVYEKPALIGLGDTLNLGMGAHCTNGSHATNRCQTGSYASSNCTPTGFTPGGTCTTGVVK